MEPTVWAKFGEYGLVGLIIAVLFFMLFKMLTWVMKWVDKQSTQHNEERIIWLKTLETLNTSIQIHNQGSIEARKNIEKANEYQREEHKEMIILLSRLNGHKDG